MKLEVMAPCFYDRQQDHPIRYLLESARRHQIEPICYGFGETFTHWIDSHIHRARKQLQEMDATHVLFTDAADVIFLAGLDEILEKYLLLHAPPVLMAYEHSGPNFGGWLAQRSTMIEYLEILSVMENGDPQERVRQAIRSHQINVALDYKRAIFQVVDGSDLEVIQAGTSKNRIRNNDTGLWPCLLHFAGAPSSRERGKLAAMEPMAKKLGYQ